ncbi:hypothetical protein ES288_A05G388000v1 [Gossypium darwinii]|uniref:Uncharacterized protein n=1 Tax=Gossypium darwinii TaxID=34276 RepID=A0A5D2GPH5_GOSDA|nr:hypothetical protein ES288_A05G388000v1 [Gossypium darwinii]
MNTAQTTATCACWTFKTYASQIKTNLGGNAGGGGSFPAYFCILLHRGGSIGVVVFPSKFHYAGDMMSHRLGVTVWLMEAARLISTRPLFLISEVDWIVLVCAAELQTLQKDETPMIKGTAHLNTFNLLFLSYLMRQTQIKKVGRGNGAPVGGNEGSFVADGPRVSQGCGNGAPVGGNEGSFVAGGPRVSQGCGNGTPLGGNEGSLVTGGPRVSQGRGNGAPVGGNKGSFVAGGPRVYVIHVETILLKTGIDFV